MISIIKPDSSTARDSLGHFTTAFVFLLAGLSMLVWNSPRLVMGQIGDPRVIGGLHWLTLGWLSLSVFGALRVFSGVALGSNGYSRWLSRAVWFLWGTGATLFPSGLIFSSPILIISGVCLIFVALFFFTLHFVPALWNATRGRLTQAYLSVAILSLWCTWLLGSGAGFLRAGWSAWTLPPGYFQAHLLVSIFGWVGSAVVGVGSHLIPMFALSSNSPQWAVKAALPVWISIPFWAVMGAFYPSPFLFLGWIAAGIGSALWVVQVFYYFSKRLRKERDWGLFIAAGATLWLPAAWIMLLGSDGIVFAGVLLIGWLTLFTLGIYHRVVPFLVWFEKYAGKAGKGHVPRVKELTSDGLAMATACLALGGALVWVAGLLLRSVETVYLGSFSILSAGLCASAQVRVLFGTTNSNR